MPKGPNMEHRPADAIGCAVNVAKIATGEMEEVQTKISGRTRSGAAGGIARRERLSDSRRSEIARDAANVRWSE